MASTSVNHTPTMMWNITSWPRTNWSAKILVTGNKVSQKMIEAQSILGLVRGRLPRGLAEGGACNGMRNGGVDGSRGGSTG